MEKKQEEIFALLAFVFLVRYTRVKFYICAVTIKSVEYGFKSNSYNPSGRNNGFNVFSQTN